MRCSSPMFPSIIVPSRSPPLTYKPNDIFLYLHESITQNCSDNDLVSKRALAGLASMTHFFFRTPNARCTSFLTDSCFSLYKIRLWSSSAGSGIVLTVSPISDISRQQDSIPIGFEHKDHSPDLKILDKIRLALKLLHFREPRVLVQFWSPHIVGNHRVLTTIDQPFGVGVIDEGLYSYIKDSKRNICVVDNNHKEEDPNPTSRVFRQGLPEWNTNLTNYLPKHFSQQEYALQCNLRGYLVLPVFHSSTRACLGVLELLTSSEYRSYAYEVRQLRIALKVSEKGQRKEFIKTMSVININKGPILLLSKHSIGCLHDD
ncbi:hypothetical protein Tco_0269909 [Tanacetum coccineum]